MTSPPTPFAPEEMSPTERAQYGAALVKGAAFDAVYGLWRRRKEQGWTNSSIAASVNVDEGWLSKQFVGPRNWTMVTFGTLVEGLNGVVEIAVRPIEEQPSLRKNYDAYAEYEPSTIFLRTQPSPAPTIVSASTSAEQSQVFKRLALAEAS